MIPEGLTSAPGLGAGSEPPATAPAPGSPGLDAMSAGAAPAAPEGSADAAPAPSPAVEKFQSCRWRAAPDVGAFCTHRDVLPFAGKEGFVAESWCPGCAYYKLRRTPKKRERMDYSY